MIKVCHMTSAHEPEDIRIFHKECVSLANAGYDVTLVECGDSYEKDNVHILGVGTKKGGRLYRMVKFSRKVYKAALQVDADIYHFHDPELLPYGLKLAKLGKKVVFDSHEKYVEQIKTKPYLPACLASAVSYCYGVYERYILKNIDAVIFPCTILGKDPFEGQCKRTAIISNATLLDEFYNLYDPDFIKKKNQICCPGSLTKKRGITQNIIAANKAGAVLALAGSYAPSQYFDEVSRMHEYSSVDYRGVLSRDAVRQLMAESVAGLATELNCGQYYILDVLSTKTVEFMAMGLPVILSDYEYNKKMVEKYHFGICIDPSNVDEQVKAMRFILDHPEEAKQMGQNGRNAVKTVFNWGVEEKKLLSLYKDLAMSLR